LRQLETVKAIRRWWKRNNQPHFVKVMDAIALLSFVSFVFFTVMVIHELMSGGNLTTFRWVGMVISGSVAFYAILLSFTQDVTLFLRTLVRR
jgi:hypothetical protein